jgi:hypothetical protein
LQLVQVGHLPEEHFEQPAQLNFNVTFAVSDFPHLLTALYVKLSLPLEQKTGFV